MAQSELRPACPALLKLGRRMDSMGLVTALTSRCGSGALGEDRGFDMNSTLILFLCSTVRSASIGSVMLCLSFTPTHWVLK